jgi:hypothetical protein
VIFHQRFQCKYGRSESGNVLLFSRGAAIIVPVEILTIDIHAIVSVLDSIRIKHWYDFKCEEFQKKLASHICFIE